MTAPVVAERRRSHIGAPGRTAREAIATVLVVVAVAVVAIVVQGTGMYDAPIRFDDEGTYVAQARAVLEEGTLSPYTYWYDHPPLGWILLAGWLATGGLLVDAPTPIGDGRAFMLVMAVLGGLLVTATCRRLGLSFVGSLAAAVLFLASPLAIAYHRMVLLDNIAMVLLLAAWALALSPRRHLAVYAAVGALAGGALMVKLTSALLLPFIAWSAWRSATGPTRRMLLTVSALGFAGVAAFFPLMAVVKGELLPGPGRVSLWEGIVFQLLSRPSSGSVLQDGSAANDVVSGWLGYDPILLPLGVVAAVLALASWRLRPFAVALLFLVVFMLRPGYLPMPYVVGLIPLAAICVAGVADLSLRAATRRAFPRDRGPRPLWGVAVGSIGAAVVLVALAPATAWPERIGRLWTVNLDQPYRASTDFLARSLKPDDVVAVDNVTWTDLEALGHPRENLIWFYRLDSDPLALERAPQEVDYIVSGDTMRVLLPQRPVLSELMERSVPIASWGTGSTKVLVYEVEDQR